MVKMSKIWHRSVNGKINVNGGVSEGWRRGGAGGLSPFLPMKLRNVAEYAESIWRLKAINKDAW